MFIDFDALRTRLNKLEQEIEDFAIEGLPDGRMRVKDYIVDPETMRCGCKDNMHNYHKTPCKHLLYWFLGLYKQQQQMTDLDDDSL